MAVTALSGKMLASSRRWDSVLDTSRLKHTIILANPRLLNIDAEDVRVGACTASWQLHLDKSLQNASKDTEAPAKQLHCAKMLHVVVECKNIYYLGIGQWLCDFGVNFRRVTAAKQQWLHVGPDQVPNCNAKLLPLMQR